MFAPEGAQACRRIPLAVIDQVVSARLGQTRVEGNAQPAVFNRQIAMYLAKQWEGGAQRGSEDSTIGEITRRYATH